MQVVVAFEPVGPGGDGVSAMIGRHLPHQGLAGHAADPEPHGILVLHNCRNRNDGKVAVAARHFAKSNARSIHWKTHGSEYFVARARRGQHVLLEFACGQHALAALGHEHDVAAEHRQRQRNFRAGIGMGDRAAHRAFVAGLKMPDMRKRRGKERQLFRKLRPGE